MWRSAESAAAWDAQHACPDSARLTAALPRSLTPGCSAPIQESPLAWLRPLVSVQKMQLEISSYARVEINVSALQFHGNKFNQPVLEVVK